MEDCHVNTAADFGIVSQFLIECSGFDLHQKPCSVLLFSQCTTHTVVTLCVANTTVARSQLCVVCGGGVLLPQPLLSLTLNAGHC